MAALAKFRPVDSSQHDKDELREIVRERSFRSGRYTLSSGIESDIYFNMKPTMMMARGAQLAALEFLKIAEQV
ncbi:MAG: orotate phosphoribosyltransferase, partial [Mesorhizobium sp.]